MVWMFQAWNMKQLGHFGSLMAFGVVLFVYNIARTLRRVPKWNVTASAITAALAWIALTVTMGLFVVAGKCLSATMEATPASGLIGGLQHALLLMGKLITRFDAISAMHAHAHLGGVGFFTMLIVGVSYKLIPMFTLSEIQNHRRAVLSVALAERWPGRFIRDHSSCAARGKLAFAIVVMIALAIYGIELAAILRARKRRGLDWGIHMFLTAVAGLLPLCVLALVLSWPGLPLNTFTGQLENLYGFLGLVGVISFAIIGMLYKIIPFLIWFGVYSKKIGCAKVPALADLYSERLQIAGYFAFVSAIAATSIGILAANGFAVRLGGLLLAASIVTLSLNVVRMLAHFIRPKIEPFAIPAP